VNPVRAEPVVVLLPTTLPQLEFIRDCHLREARYAGTITERAQHLAHADDIQRRIDAAAERTEHNPS
jgi:hypothetical protein